MARSAGSGYLALPDAREGPGVLVLHAWWGLTPFFKQVCDRLAESGFVALAPDLHGGATTADPAQATPDRPIATLGFSMGASWALWVASRMPEQVAATVAFYGTQSVDMSPATSAFLGHFAEVDTYVDDDERTLLEADLHVLDKDVTFHHYPGTGHWFFEADQLAYDEPAATLAWDRTLAFLRKHLG
jgi:carboxymethylenebutenolidase